MRESPAVQPTKLAGCLDVNNAVIPVSSDNPMPVTLTDSSSLDAFGRLRVSMVHSLFNHQNIYGLDDDIFETWNTGAGSTAAFLSNEGSTLLTCGATSGNKITRQTYRYFPYTPGKSQLIQNTGVFGVGVSGIKICKRSFVSGAVVTTSVNQADWNYDTLDGTGISGKTLDPTKGHIFHIDFQYLGVGRVRYGFVIDGVLCICHLMNHANVESAVYMSTPTLPVRYEIENLDGVSLAKRIGYFDDANGLYFEAISPVANNTMKQICSTVVSEGGTHPEGEQFSAPPAASTIAVTTRRPVFAIRMAAAINGKDNRRMAKLLHSHVYATANDAFVDILHCHDPITVTGTWVSAGVDSGVEYSADISVATFTTAHLMSTFFVTAGQGQSGEVVQETTEFANEHDRISTNRDCTKSSYIVMFATSLNLTSAISPTMSWLEA